MSTDGGHPRITDRLFYWIAGACGLATGVVGAAFHLAVDQLLHWPHWLAEHMGTGPLTIAAGAAATAVPVTAGYLLTPFLAPETERADRRPAGTEWDDHETVHPKTLDIRNPVRQDH